MFCLKCGKPVKGTTTSTARTETRWEYCEIVCIRSGFLGGKSYFVAQAAGNKGRYEAARSTKPFDSIETSYGGAEPETYAWGTEKKAKAALDEIMSSLSADGWELTGEKKRWWEYKYRCRENHSVPGDTSTISSPSRVETKMQWLKKSLNAIEQKHYHEAISASGNVIQLDPNDAKAYYIRGFAYFRVAQLEKAVADFDRAIELDPKDARSYIERGFAYTLLRKYEKALPDYDRGIQLDPKDARAYFLRGLVYFEILEDYQKALADYDRTIQDDPENDAAYNQRGSTYLGLKQYEKALADFEHAIELNPNNTTAQKGREVAYRLLKGQ
jgi:tetratricopeptide (TPR) repeat protein